MMRHAWKAAALLLAAVIALCAWRAVGTVRALARAPAAGERTGLGSAADRVLSLPRDHPLGRIALPGRAVVFAYSPDCAVCHANMANWIDIASHARASGMRLIAAAPVQTEDARRYWEPLGESVDVILSDTAMLARVLGVGGTPATLLVHDGVVRRVYDGALTPAARRQVMGFVARGVLPDS
ncbi:MAG TPA: hypothetical protein VFQ45_12265 [Longimicrobium sp.]|nr:hypothetical protein [Longimicrobium sp.]